MSVKSSPGPQPPVQTTTQQPGEPQLGSFCANAGQRIGNEVCDPASEQGYPANTWHPV